MQAVFAKVWELVFSMIGCVYYDFGQVFFAFVLAGVKNARILVNLGHCFTPLIDLMTPRRSIA